ncbi:MAG: Free methionine-R-sulfoxide reductase [Tenericutes bacterium ADurb.BinA155]|nr:MAG: Free methionine-R-sulfoxide reductase [Tenericutes bacterium ADurb.BinA155]
MENFDQASLLASLKGFDSDPLLKKSHLYNALALLHVALPPKSWIGVYLYDETSNLLILGPFAGTPACESIKPNHGVVGTCFSKQKTIVVPDVHQFPGYICCDPSASAELVVPLKAGKRIHGVLDIDYPKGYSFEGESAFYEAVSALITTWLW